MLVSQTEIEPAQAEGRTSEDYSGVVGKGLLKRRLESEAPDAKLLGVLTASTLAVGCLGD